MSAFLRRAGCVFAVSFAALSLAGCTSNDTVVAQTDAPQASAPAAAASAQPGQAVTLPSGLQMTDHKIGTGRIAQPGYIAVVHYTGWLYQNGAKGKKFDSSVDRGQPFEFPVGAGRVIKGWDQGVTGMKTGGKRTLIVPSELGYGARGAGRDIPPNATLIFDVELLGVKG